VCITETPGQAITSNAVGKGRAIKFAWLPGLSYWFAQYPPGSAAFANRVSWSAGGDLPRDEEMRQILAGIASIAQVAAPVTASHSRIETPLLIAADRKSAVVSLLNFQPNDCFCNISKIERGGHCDNVPVPAVPSLHLKITLPFRPSALVSVQHGKVSTFTVAARASGEWIVSVQIALEFADFLMLS
jgi:hypothetical protein